MSRKCQRCGARLKGRQEKWCSGTCRKRSHEEAQPRECEQCGQELGSKSRYPAQAHWKLCAECKRDNGYHRTVTFIELRERGLSNLEIERREELPFNTVAVTLNRAGRYGLKVPPPPYWSRGKVAA